MLPKINRVKKKTDFDAIFKGAQKSPRSSKTNFLIIKTAKNGLEMPRVGIVVSKKISKKAVVRNKVRRRLSVTIKGQFENIKKGTDNIFIALPGIEKKDFSEIKEIVKKCLDQ